MKTAYELAMERLSKTAPAVTLTDAQKKQLAELDTLYTAKIAERELALGAELAKAEAADDLEAAEKWRAQLAKERQSLQAERDEKKDRVRQRKGPPA